MHIKKMHIIGLLFGLLLTACSNTVPLVLNPDKLAYAILDDKGNPTQLCFDTISPNHCIYASDETLKHYKLKKQILLKEYILILDQPSQIDCLQDSPTDCRVFFEHIYVDISVDPDDIKIIEKGLKDIEI